MIKYNRHIKPVIERIVALLLIILLSPLYLVVGLILMVSLKGSPWFIQIRPGKNEKLFKLLKFKTMLDLHDESGNLLPDYKRITSVGRVVRSWSLDELPQLINVLIGDMSFIGPRPLLVEYLPLYNEQQRKRHLVRPGITGWAQVNGRNSIPWEERFDMDLWYVKKESLSLDLKILFLSLINVFKRKDINESLTNTMSPFTGSKY